MAMTQVPAGEQETGQRPQSVLLTSAQQRGIQRLRARRGMPAFAAVMREAVNLLLEREGLLEDEAES